MYIIYYIVRYKSLPMRTQLMILKIHSHPTPSSCGPATYIALIVKTEIILCIPVRLQEAPNIAFNFQKQHAGLLECLPQSSL